MEAFQNAMYEGFYCQFSKVVASRVAFRIVHLQKYYCEGCRARFVGRDTIFYRLNFEQRSVTWTFLFLVSSLV